MKILLIPETLCFFTFANYAFAGSAPPDSAVYFCQTKIASGISYNDVSKEWEATRFKPGKNFMLKFRRLASMHRKGVFGLDETVYSYKVKFTESGSNTSADCDALRPPYETIETTNEYMRFQCNLTDYRLNTTNNRFLASYLIGYISGKDNNNDTPSVIAGVCTKIQ